MNKQDLKIMVATLEYEKLFELLKSKDYDITELEATHNRLQSIKNHSLSTGRTYSIKQWEEQYTRNQNIAKGLLKIINSMP